MNNWESDFEQQPELIPFRPRLFLKSNHVRYAACFYTYVKVWLRQ